MRGRSIGQRRRRQGRAPESHHADERSGAGIAADDVGAAAADAKAAEDAACDGPLAFVATEPVGCIGTAAAVAAVDVVDAEATVGNPHRNDVPSSATARAIGPIATKAMTE